MGRVKVNGVELHCVTAGAGPVMLFLHGFPEFWYEWKRQLEEFGKDHLAVAPDLRGYNLSEKPGDVEQYRINVLVQDIRGLAEHFSPGKKFVLVGHDWGGAVAWAFAIAFPELLRKLVIINAPHPGIFRRLLASDPEQQNASAYMTMFQSAEAEGILSANNYGLLVNVVMGEGLKTGIFTEEDKAEYLKAWSQPGALTGGLNYYRANHLGPPAAGQVGHEIGPPGTDYWANPAKLIVRVPTLVIWGEKDTALTLQNLRGLEEFVPELIVKRVADASHWVIHEKPEAVNGFIREFIGENS
jgi:pimeloyl-ACP methyl ester carboxylesterase